MCHRQGRSSSPPGPISAFTSNDYPLDSRHLDSWHCMGSPLAVWIAIKHFREVQRPATGWAVGNCLMVLMKTRVFYFAA
ncbi:hypothetical protein K503DRAFT_218986 [Rhizopogon vinicolor AM-OR11-026]|uniref:Uncharacterized protein n=1 Tax=Rhizopogon vinicolor AM-OR11-026 TaxID=1314800 RepID=A0A1B7MYL4_9AGAM|nr:hypothetical protein K503DRAFT_218986 [Rhizopogon vinicolor AM-OR11-026]